MSSFRALQQKIEYIEWASSFTLLILIAEGAPGKPGMHVLKAATSENGPRPHEFNPQTRNL